ncbi:hypothetical protein KAX75_02730, partial [candidate division WOR-3 bacterium]|nr:hypothetical protein [candidate division WOR-3 bacterium]
IPKPSTKSFPIIRFCKPFFLIFSSLGACAALKTKPSAFNLLAGFFISLLSPLLLNQMNRQLYIYYKPLDLIHRGKIRCYQA